MSSDQRAFSRIEVEASEWLVAMGDRTVSLEEHARFDAWLHADPEHARVYRTQKAAWSAVAQMPHLLTEADAASATTRHKRVAVRWLPLSLAAAVGLIVLGSLFVQDERFETAIAQVKDIKLDDGTLVTLGASSDIEVDFSSSERRVTLTRGEAFFEVTRDTARPFFVMAGDTLVRVVGTKFDVHYGPATVRVSVAEGRVEVTNPSGQAVTHKVLTAGDAVIADQSGGLAVADNVKTEDLGAWRQGRLVYVDARLRDVVADINRYYDGRIRLAEASVGDLQLTTAFRADQIDRMLEVLESALPVEAKRTADRQIVLSHRK